MCVRILSGAYMIECSSYMRYVARMNVFVICDYVRLRCAYMLCFGFDASLIWIFFFGHSAAKYFAPSFGVVWDR